MAKMLKLDLHTHPIEALKEKMGIKGILDINKEVAFEIVKAIKTAGLNGIAITEHSNFNYSWVTCMEIMDQFPAERLILLPGAEIDYNGQQLLQLYIPDRYRRRIPFFQGKEWFWILAHPGYYNPLDMDSIRRIEIDAIEEKSIHGEFSLARPISQERNLPTSRSSDAHKLEDIGRFSTEVEFG
jgi:histidinol phosphatase-like PHP family hydrolase